MVTPGGRGLSGELLVEMTAADCQGSGFPVVESAHIYFRRQNALRLRYSRRTEIPRDEPAIAPGDDAKGTDSEEWCNFGQ